MRQTKFEHNGGAKVSQVVMSFYDNVNKHAKVAVEATRAMLRISAWFRARSLDPGGGGAHR